MPTRRLDSRAFTVTVTVVAVVCAAPMAMIVALSGAPSTVVLATVLAAVPVGPVVWAYLWLDRYEPEPRSLLALGLVWGAVVATLAALLVGGIGQMVSPVSPELSATLVAPVTEEASKGVFLVLLLWWRRHEIDGVLDGLVYAGLVGVGFAFVENILYLAAAYDGTDGVGPGGTQAVTATFVVRCLASPFAHPLFTAFTGLGVGIAVTSRHRVLRVVALPVGYLVAVLAHSTWNRAALDGTFVGVYLVLMLPAFLLLVALAVWARSRERRVLAAALADAARRGLFPASDIAWVVDLRARRHARDLARRRAGREAARDLRDYQEAAVELGFLHHRYLRGTAPRDATRRGQLHVDRLAELRPRLPFAGGPAAQVGAR